MRLHSISESIVEETTGWVSEFMAWLVHITDQLGYIGLLVMTFVESSVIPLPIEATLIPVGYLVDQGKMHFIPALMVSVIGTIIGSFFNYWLARKFGRGLFIRYGRYFMMTDEKFSKFEAFFREHGAMSTFTGRLLPGLRHYIALPAGLAHMAVDKFLLYTTLGAVVLSSILIGIGYFIGASEGPAKEFLPYIKLGLLLLVMLGVAVYVWRHYMKKRRAPPPQ